VRGWRRISCGLQFLRVMRSHPGTSLDDPGNLIGPPWPFPEEVEEAHAEADGCRT
jgi:hypothetical protein